MTDELLRPEGMRALHAEREKNRVLRQTVREKDRALHNLRAEVIATTNELIDLLERDGAVRAAVEGVH